MDLAADEQSTEGRMQLAVIRKEKGNALFAAGEYRQAIGWYGRSMTLIGASADDQRVVNSTTQSYCPTPVGDLVRICSMPICSMKGICSM